MISCTSIKSILTMKISIFLISLFSVAFAFPGEKDEVLILPGLRIQPSFKHYSGYLNGSNTRKLHYWFVTSQSSPNQDPLVLWMNGGPGCSSLDGLLTEHGPFRVTNGGYLEYNKYSWNKIANIIYLESPACVGFSFSTDGKCDATDETTSLLNYNALKDFFVKFPQFKGRDFYISGESYAGFYVPTLATRIALSKEIPYVKMKGILIGNGLSSITINWNGDLHFAYNHGLISDSVWRDIINTCCNNMDPLHCDILDSLSQDCSDKVDAARSVFGDINPYNIYSPCLASTSSNGHSIWSNLNVSSNYDRFKIMMGWIDQNNHKLSLLRKKYIILKKVMEIFGKKPSVSPPCTSDSIIANFLNRERVRYALHIPPNVAPWSLCSSTIDYTTIYKNMDVQYNIMFNLKDFKIWLYNGDVDMVCSYLSEEWYFEGFNRPVTQIRKPWMYKCEDNTTQVGGFVKIWDKFVLLTVRGAGHMVPTDKPIPAYHMFESFLIGKPL